MSDVDPRLLARRASAGKKTYYKHYKRHAGLGTAISVLFDLRRLLQLGREINHLATKALWHPARLLLMVWWDVKFNHLGHPGCSLLPAALIALPTR